MFARLLLSAALGWVFAVHCVAQEGTATKPAELDCLKAFVGVWDAEIEVWLE